MDLLELNRIRSVVSDTDSGEVELSAPKTEQDIWSAWLLDKRFGGKPQVMKAAIDDYFLPVRDKVLENAKISEHDVLLDIGTGTGLIAFGALTATAARKVIFSDISPTLLNHTESVARSANWNGRCDFLLASAEDLSAIKTSSVDVVTVCCVLIHVAAKQLAFSEFCRVLKPGGRLSVFEPINRVAVAEPENSFSGFDVTPVAALAKKVKAIYLRNQPPACDPMLDFDERKLVELAQGAGFGSIQLEFRIKTERPKISDWDALVHRPPNPRAPSLEAAMEEALTPEEKERFVAHIRPLVESRRGIKKSAVAYLTALKD
jgi:ubiquinone/menaquinone biosynthesis C-methylase UbiE